MKEMRENQYENSKKENEKRRNMLFCFLCCFVYFTSYCTRINYAAILVELLRDMGITKELASVAVTGSFITYGIGQLVSGIMGDHIKPHIMIMTGLCATSFINFLMPLLPGIYSMNFFWCFNGFFQSMLWPPLVRMMVEKLETHIYVKVCTLVNAAGLMATIAVYSFTPIVILIWGWRFVFFSSGCLGAGTAVFWFLGTRITKHEAEEKRMSRQSEAIVRTVEGMTRGEAKEKDRLIEKNRHLLGFLIITMAAITLQGILRDGITTWMPAYMNEVYMLDSSLSIFTTVILPVFGIFGIIITSKIQQRLNNEFAVASLLFAFAFTSSMVMLPLFGENIICTVLFIAVIIACMYGINLMLISYLPKQFARFGRISTISGTLNAFTYVGSAVSTYGFAVLSEQFGWYFIIISWAMISAAGLILCTSCIRRWHQFDR